MDKIFIALALTFSAVAAVSTPINTLLLAFLLDAMVDYGRSLYDTSIPNEQAGEEFLQDLFFFAIYNVIVGVLLIALSYAATTLMNIAAYNQVRIGFNTLNFCFRL